MWILVNDGSSDNTEVVANDLLSLSDFPIMYLSKENGGKHSAFKVALDNTRTEYFQCMDDDDIFSPEAVNTYLSEWARIKKQGKDSEIGAIRTLTKYAGESGSIVSSRNFPLPTYGRVDMTTLECNFIRHIHMENWTCYLTAALRSVDLFPKNYWLHQQHKFFNEAIWQGCFARKYKCRYYYVCLREYNQDAPFSLIRSKKNYQHYMDMFINTKMLLDEQIDYYMLNPYSLFKSIAIISILRHKLKIPLKDLLYHTPSLLLKICYIISSFVSVLSPYPKISKE